MRQAIIAIEDHRFYEHGPLDAAGHAAGVPHQLRRRGRRPGRLHHHPAVREDGADRGGQEAGRRSRASRPRRTAATGARSASCGTPSRSRRRLSKDEILERYLNIAYFGDGAYGIEVAAEHYFGTQRRQADPAAGRPAGRPGAEPDRPQPAWPIPTAALGPARRGAEPDGRARHDHRRRRPPRRRKRRSTEDDVDDDHQRLPAHRVPLPVRLRLPLAGPDPEPRRAPSRSGSTPSSAAD